jgi:hypothetical protein
MMAFRHSLVLGALALFTTTRPLWAQDRSAWAEREFGIGVVRYAEMYNYQARDVILSAPDATADTVALLNRDELCIVGLDGCVRSYQGMIEFDYEVPGFAILGFSPDSGWVNVTLDPGAREGALTGWIQLRPPAVRPVLWSDLLAERAQFFIRPADIRFYARPGGDTPVRLPLTRQGDRLDYILHPLAAQGRWLQVEVESPSTFCRRPAPAARRDTVWIEYLTETMRPRVFFYTRGC